MSQAQEAAVAQSAEPYQAAPRPRFPALDPEPPRRPWRTAALVLIVTLALAGGVSYVALSPGGSRRHVAAPAVSRTSDFNGIVLSEARSGLLSLTDLRTGKEDLPRHLGEFGGSAVVSGDDKFLIDPGTGKLFSLTNVLHPAAVPNQLNFSPNTTASYPWSDHDSYVVVLPPSFSYGSIENGDLTLQSVRTGTTIDLGAADSAAGDPQQAGAFFSVPSSSTPPAATDQPGPDSRLVLADAGASPQVLATASALTDALGFGPRTPVTLQPVVNPQGTKVAVEVAADNRPSRPAGIVVLSRSGHVLDATRIAGGSSPAMLWSAAGTSLAFVSAAASGQEQLVQWKIGAKAMNKTPLPQGYLVGQCLWSPDNSAVLCDGYLGSLTALGPWVVIASGRAHVLAGHGQVLAWLRGRLGR